jgi:hypothetical protein
MAARLVLQTTKEVPVVFVAATIVHLMWGAALWLALGWREAPSLAPQPAD